MAGGDILGDIQRLLAATHTITVATGVISIWRHDAVGMAQGTGVWWTRMAAACYSGWASATPAPRAAQAVPSGRWPT